MDQDKSPKMQLSKNVRLMKFMQRTNTEKQDSRSIDDTHWYLNDETPTKGQRIIKECSYVTCEQLLPIGRMSFKNFNPKIEKIYNHLLNGGNDTLNKKDDNDGEDISDEEMAQRFESLVDTVHKKFSRKRKRDFDDTPSRSDTEQGRKMKKKFIKPSSD